MENSQRSILRRVPQVENPGSTAYTHPTYSTPTHTPHSVHTYTHPTQSTHTHTPLSPHTHTPHTRYQISNYTRYHGDTPSGFRMELTSSIDDVGMRHVDVWLLPDDQGRIFHVCHLRLRGARRSGCNWLMCQSSYHLILQYTSCHNAALFCAITRSRSKNVQPPPTR